MRTITSKDVPWMYIIVFAILALAIGLVGDLYYQEQKEEIKEEKKKELSAIIDLKVRQIIDWRKERYDDALTIYKNRLVASTVNEWLENPAVVRHKEDIVSWLETRVRLQPYTKAYLLDKTGTIRLRVGTVADEIGAHVQSDVKEVLKSKKIIFGDFEKDAPGFGIHLDIFVPLVIVREKDTVSVAVVFLQINPQDSFFPLLESFSIQNKTSEALLVRQEGDSVVFINETRDHKHPPLSLRLPMSQSWLPVARFFKSGEEVVEGIDYAGIPVLAVIRKVPDSPWGIVVKVNTEEMYAPIRDRESAIGIFAGLLIFTSAAVLGMLWRHERSLYYRRQYELERERKALEEHYDYATKYANDIIIMADEKGRVIDINERGLIKYGYTQDEIRNLNIADIRGVMIMTPLEEGHDGIGKDGGLLFESRHHCKDGTSFPVEVSARAITIDNKTFYQSIVRDITERKQAEEKLKALNHLYYMLSQINQAIVHANDKNEFFQAVCNISVKFGGFLMAWIGMLDDNAKELKPVGQSGLDNSFLSLITDTLKNLPSNHPISKALMGGERYVCNDFEKDQYELPWREGASKGGFRSFAVFPIQMHSQTVGVFAVNSSKVDFFDQDELTLLDEIVIDISFALENIEKEKDRKLAEEALRESAYWFRESQKAGRIGSYATDFTTGYWQSSEALDDIFGIDKYFERTVEGWSNLIHPEQREEMVKYLEKIITQKTPFDKEYKIVRVNDGEERWVYGRGELVFADNGSPLKMVGTIQDITERKKAAELIALHSRALESAANAIVITDCEGKIISVNPAFSRFTGYSASEVIGKNPKILNSGTQSPSFYKNLWETILSGQVWRGNIVNKRKDGSLYDEEMTITPVHDEQGKISYFIAIKQDVTESRKLHVELSQMQKMESIGTLASGIAHDFNNILGIILGYASLIDRDPQSLSQSVASINAAVNRGASLVKQILTFARKTTVIIGPLEINTMAKEIVKMLRETFPKTIEISFQLDKTNPTINADATQVHQAILNLCINARDAMPAGGILTLKTDIVDGESLRNTFPDVSESSYVHLAVIDTGIGIDETIRAQIFDPFFTTKEKGKGTGLGLSVVYGMVKEHHGFVNVESDAGKGSTFNLYFPILQGRAPAAVEGSVEHEKIPAGHETLLVVEDEETLLEMLKVVIEEKGYHVITANDGLQALEVYRSRKDEINMVLSDVGLPKITGELLFGELKKLNPSVKVILASGYIDINSKSEVLKAGVKEFIQKPYFPDEVLKKIREVLDRK
ncbi:MAG: PAS domain S-box protein [Bacteroidota bacterium]